MTMGTQQDSLQDQNTERQKVAELIKDIRFAMLTTTTNDGLLRSRPMTMLDQEFNGDLYFFVSKSAPQVSEMQAHSQINLSFGNPAANVYVSISGTAQLLHDQQQIDALWKPIYKAFFPKGKDDPELMLLQVHTTEAEYWDSPNGKLVQVVSFAKALVTGEQAPLGENEKVDLRP